MSNTSTAADLKEITSEVYALYIHFGEHFTPRGKKLRFDNSCKYCQAWHGNLDGQSMNSHGQAQNYTPSEECSVLSNDSMSQSVEHALPRQEKRSIE